MVRLRHAYRQKYALVLENLCQIAAMNFSPSRKQRKSSESPRTGSIVELGTYHLRSGSGPDVSGSARGASIDSFVTVKARHRADALPSRSPPRQRRLTGDLPALLCRQGLGPGFSAFARAQARQGNGVAVLRLHHSGLRISDQTTASKEALTMLTRVSIVRIYNPKERT
jgi:hypothetical protein